MIEKPIFYIKKATKTNFIHNDSVLVHVLNFLNIFIYNSLNIYEVILKTLVKKDTSSPLADNHNSRDSLLTHYHNHLPQSSWVQKMMVILKLRSETWIIVKQLYL